MAYVVLARKYRPQTFKDFVGQEAIAETLSNAIANDRVAHAYLFCGPRGVGKTSMARVFSKALNCAKGPTVKPCDKCDICRSIATGNDVDVIEIDGASNRGIDEVREIRQNAKYSPSRSRHKIYIIDEVHMLTEQAFNALLKTLEEPPPHVKFILATTAPAKLPETIHSRLQRFTFRRVDVKTLTSHLKKLCKREQVEVDAAVLELVSRQARGSVRDALSMLDQALAFCGAEATVEKAAACLGAASDDEMWKLVDAIAGRDAPEILRLADVLVQRGVGVGDILQQLTGLVRDMLVARHCGPDADLLGRPPESAKAVAERAARFQPDALLYMIQVLSEARRRGRDDVDARVVLETALVKLSRHEDLAPVQELLDRLAEMESRLAQPGGSPPRPTPGPGPGREPGPQPPSRQEPAERTSAPGRAHAAAVGAGPHEAAGDELWPQIVESVKDRDGFVGRLLANATAEWAGDSLIVRYPAGNDRILETLRSPAARELMESSSASVAGRPVTVRLEVAGPAQGAETPETQAAKDPLVEAAVRIFDARVLRIERPEPEELREPGEE